MFYSEPLNAVMLALGNGTTQVEVKVGEHSDIGHVTAITFRHIEGYKIGDAIHDMDKSEEQGFGLLIKNLESLQVLEEALVVCRNNLTK